VSSGLKKKKEKKWKEGRKKDRGGKGKRRQVLD
jgi:hypothetical protein